MDLRYLPAGGGSLSGSTVTVWLGTAFDGSIVGGGVVMEFPFVRGLMQQALKREVKRSEYARPKRIELQGKSDLGNSGLDCSAADLSPVPPYRLQWMRT